MQAQELTGIAVPKYYNPAAVNPLKYAEQVQKRKLLWSKNKDKKEVGILKFNFDVDTNYQYWNRFKTGYPAICNMCYACTYKRGKVQIIK